MSVGQYVTERFIGKLILAWLAALILAGIGTVYTPSLLRRRLLILLSGRCGVEEDKGTAAAVPDTNDSA